MVIIDFRIHVCKIVGLKLIYCINIGVFGKVIRFSEYSNYSDCHLCQFCVFLYDDASRILILYLLNEEFRYDMM